MAAALAWAVVLVAGAVQAGDDVDFMAPFDENLGERIREANQSCLRCHSEAGLKAPPRADMDMTKLARLLVDAEAYARSGHDGIDCRDCHNKGFADFPHGAADGGKATTKLCGECHTAAFPPIEAEYKRSIHYRRWPDRFPCETCHNPHVYQSAAKIDAPRAIVAQDNGFCLDCHQKAERFNQFSPEKSPPPDLDKAHAWLPHTAMHWQAVRCVDCHTPEAKGMSHEVQTKDKAGRRCADCHNADSSLRTRLFQHRVVDEPARVNRWGFINAVMLGDHYVVGATRNVWLERASVIILGLMLAGIVAHIIIRIVAWRRRK